MPLVHSPHDVLGRSLVRSRNNVLQMVRDLGLQPTTVLVIRQIHLAGHNDTFIDVKIVHDYQEKALLTFEFFRSYMAYKIGPHLSGKKDRKLVPGHRYFRLQPSSAATCKFVFVQNRSQI